MIRGLREALDDLDRPPGIDRSPKQDFLKQISADRSGTGEAHQDSPGLDQPHAQHVDIFVAASRFVNLAFAAGEFGGI
jgi:hypothetical protein